MSSAAKVPTPTQGVTQSIETPFAKLGGATALRTLVEHFYDLMEIEPAYADLRRVHAADLGKAREKLYLFLSGWLGGPDLYVERYGHPQLRARHLPFSIGLVERDQWLACMKQALGEQQVPTTLQERLMQAFFQTADWMRNRAE